MARELAAIEMVVKGGCTFSGIQSVAILLRRMLVSARLSSAMEVTCTE